MGSAPRPSTTLMESAPGYIGRGEAAQGHLGGPGGSGRVQEGPRWPGRAHMALYSPNMAVYGYMAPGYTSLSYPWVYSAGALLVSGRVLEALGLYSQDDVRGTGGPRGPGPVP